MLDPYVRARRARGSLLGRMLFAALFVLAACINSFAAPLPPATNGVIAFSGSGFVNPDGTGLTYWTYSLYEPAWSSDGKKIAFQADFLPDDPTQTQCDCLVVANADGSGAVQLTEGFGRMPAWAPDGSKIIFSSGGWLNVVNSDGSNLVMLPLTGFRPSWSPDGTRIIFDWQGGVWTANPDGTNPTRVHDGREPAWSRDGNRIAFSLYDENVGNWEIHTANPDGSNVTQLTFRTGAGSDDGTPAWSPDGTRLVFYRDASDTPDGLYVINADGSGQTLIVAGDTPQFPAWQPIPTAPAPFSFTGFFSPIGAAGTLNVAKAGSAIPIKFSLGGNRGLNIFAAGSPSTQAVSCSGGGSVSAAVVVNTPGKSELSYDAKSGQYTYVMKTEKGWANTCRTLTVTLTDGTSHKASFKFN